MLRCLDEHSSMISALLASWWTHSTRRSGALCAMLTRARAIHNQGDDEVLVAFEIRHEQTHDGCENDETHLIPCLERTRQQTYDGNGFEFIILNFSRESTYLSPKIVKSLDKSRNLFAIDKRTKGDVRVLGRAGILDTGGRSRSAVVLEKLFDKFKRPDGTSELVTVARVNSSHIGAIENRKTGLLDLVAVGASGHSGTLVIGTFITEIKCSVDLEIGKWL